MQVIVAEGREGGLRSRVRHFLNYWFLDCWSEETFVRDFLLWHIFLDLILNMAELK